MYDSCIYDMYEQCFHNCPNCPQYDGSRDSEDMWNDFDDEEGDGI